MRGKIHTWQKLALWIPYAWLALFFLAPFLFVLKISLADPALAQPPYTPLLSEQGGGLALNVSFDNYRYVFSDTLYPFSYLNSIRLALYSTFGCLLLGFPMAYGIAHARPAARGILLLLAILPFWISFLLRVYAWMGILSNGGILNTLLLKLGITEQPLTLLYTEPAVLIGMIYSYLPFMVLPLYAVLERLDQELIDAAADLGASPLRVLTDVIVPLSLPGIAAGSLLVFIPSMGEFVVPALLGDSDILMIGRVLYDEFFVNRDWPAAAAATVVLLLALALPYWLLRHAQRRSAPA
jgi:putrescine transport system permease protein